MKRSMVSVMILAAVLAFLYVPIILVVVYGFVPNPGRRHMPQNN